MEYELYVIYDAATGMYGAPMAQTNDAEALRSFRHEAENPKSLWNSHPSDFILYKVGIYYSGTGELSAYNSPERIASAAEVIRREK